MRGVLPEFLEASRERVTTVRVRGALAAVVVPAALGAATACTPDYVSSDREFWPRACDLGRGGCDGGGGAGGGCNDPCEAPPPPTCAAPAVLRIYTGPGICSEGACAYPSTDLACPSAVCVGGSCAPNCAVGGPGLTDCGPAGNEDCCTSLPVPGGTFYRSYADVTGGYTSPAYPAIVSEFRLDKYEVTVGRLRKFKAAWEGGWRPEAGGGKHVHLNGGRGLTVPGGTYEPGWNPEWTNDVALTDVNLSSCDPRFRTWTPAAGANENRPMSCVNWYEAAAFCIWDGGFLPSEAEWTYAAAGGSEQRVYPWSVPAESTDVSCLRASYDCWNNDCADGVIGCELADRTDVGTRPSGEGRWGQSDLAGNVWEWVLDAHVGPYHYSADMCIECCNCVLSSADRVSRGGGFTNTQTDLRASSHREDPPATRVDDVGARCARSGT